MKVHSAVKLLLQGSILLALTFSCKEKIDNEDGPSGLPPTGSPYGNGAIMAYSTFDFSTYCPYMTVMVDTTTAFIASKSIGSVDCQSTEVAYIPGLSGGKRHMVFINCGSLYWIDSLYSGDPCSVYPVSYASAYPGFAILTVFLKQYTKPNPVNLIVYVDGAIMGSITQVITNAECGEPAAFTSYPLPIGQHHWKVFDPVNNITWGDAFYDLEEGCNRWFIEWTEP